MGPKVGRRSSWFLAGFCRVFSAAAIFVASFAVAGRAVPIQHGTLDLIAENSWIAPGQSFTLGLHFKLDPGWHIYWKNPGDSGEPPQVTWQLPQGMTAGDIEWPAPTRMMTSTIMNYVYDDEVLLLVPMRASQSFAAPQSGVKLDASVRLLICSKEMCVPAKAQLSISLPTKTQSPMPDKSVAALFASARAHLPKPAPAGWQFSWNEKQSSLVLRARTGRSIASAYFFPLDDLEIDYSAKQEFAPSAAGFQLTLRKSNQLTKPVSRLRGVLVLADGRAYLVDVPAGGPGGNRAGS